MIARFFPPIVARRAGKPDDRVLFFNVAADQFVGLADPDDFLHARHVVERALLDLALVARDADRRARGAGHGMCPVSERLDPLTNGAYLLFRGMRLHDNQHDPTSKSRVYRGNRPRANEGRPCPARRRPRLRKQVSAQFHLRRWSDGCPARPAGEDARRSMVESV